MSEWVENVRHEKRMGKWSFVALVVNAGFQLLIFMLTKELLTASNLSARSATDLLVLNPGTLLTTDLNRLNGCEAQITGNAQKSWKGNGCAPKEEIRGLKMLAEKLQMTQFGWAYLFAHLVAPSAAECLPLKHTMRAITGHLKLSGFACHATRRYTILCLYRDIVWVIEFKRVNG